MTQPKRSPEEPNPREEKCIYCNGRGVIEIKNFPDGKPYPYRNICLDCKGTGKRCSECLYPISECQCW